MTNIVLNVRKKEEITQTVYLTAIYFLYFFFYYFYFCFFTNTKERRNFAEFNIYWIRAMFLFEKRVYIQEESSLKIWHEKMEVVKTKSMAIKRIKFIFRSKVSSCTIQIKN